MATSVLRKVAGAGLDRAVRYAIEIPLRYRPSDEVGWHQGKTENISSTGVLFRAEQPLALNTTVEMSFELPSEMGGDGEANLLCRGRIVRAVEPLATNENPALAAQINDYRLACGQ